MERGNKKEKESKKRLATVLHIFFLSLSICIPFLIPRHQGATRGKERKVGRGERERERENWVVGGKGKERNQQSTFSRLGGGGKRK
jgi:hypothetical protein